MTEQPTPITITITRETEDGCVVRPTWTTRPDGGITWTYHDPPSDDATFSASVTFVDDKEPT